MKAIRSIADRITAHNKYTTEGCKNGRPFFDVIEEIRKAFRDLTSELDKPTNQVNNVFNNIQGGVTPQNVPYPFSLEEDSDLYPDGLSPLFGVPCTIVGMELLCDPSYTAPTGDVSFVVQNAANAPTSSGVVTVPSGSRKGSNMAMQVTFGANQLLHIKTPSDLHGLQNLYTLRFLAVPLQT